MQIGEQNLPFSQQAVLGRQRFLHFDDHVRFREDALRAIDHLCPDADVIFVGITRPDARAFLNQNSMALARQGRGSRGDEPDTVLLRFNLFRNADDHAEDSDQ